MKKTISIFLIGLSALGFVGLAVGNAVVGNISAAVGFGCAAVLAIIIMFDTLELASMRDLCDRAISENSDIIELNDRINKTNGEMLEQCQKMLRFNRNLFRIVDEMKRYLTSEELEAVNESVKDTGFEFLHTGRDYELYCPGKDVETEAQKKEQTKKLTLGGIPLEALEDGE